MAITESAAQLPFKKAIELFAKKMGLGKADLAKMTDALTDMAFFVSDLNNMALLSEVYELCSQAIAEGWDFKDFAPKFEDAVTAGGWTPKEGISRRAKAVYETNLRQAYQGGRNLQMTETKLMKKRPLAEWVHRDSRQHRPAHKAIDGMIFRLEDLIANKLLCPNGFGCRCTLITHRTPPDGKDVSAIPSATMTLKNKRTGEKFVTPAVSIKGKKYPLVEPGFNYNPGLMSEEDKVKFKKEMKGSLSEPFRKLI